MDPLSVAASVAGLVMAGAHISSKLQGFISGSGSAPSLARATLDEIHDFSTVLRQLQPFILGSALPSHSRASMIDVDQFMITLTGCVCTFSELEREVGSLEPQDRMGIRGRMMWAWKESNIASLVQRLQNHKSSLNLMLTILTCLSSTEATSSMNQLCAVVEQLAESNARLMASNTQMSNRLRTLESKLVLKRASTNSSRSTVMLESASSGSSTLSFRTMRSYRLAFENTLFNTDVYRRAKKRISVCMTNLPSASSTIQASRWSVLSGISLAEVSSISVLSLPLSANQLYNPRWYTTGATTTTTTSKATNQVSQLAYPPDSFELHYAAMAGNVEMVRRLIHGGAPIESRNEDGYSPLHFAAHYGHDEVAWVLFEGGASVDGKTNHDKTALHLAVEKGRVDVATRLLISGADMELRNMGGYTALLIAVEMADYPMVDMLLREPPADIEAKTPDGTTSMHLAAQRGLQDIFCLLLERGADMEAQNNDGYTPLHLAVLYGCNWVIETLLERGAAVNIKTQNGNTPLHFAAEKGNDGSLDQLLTAGAEKEWKNVWGYTALIAAAVEGRLGAVRLLLLREADVEARCNNGSTALHLAAENGHETVVAHLLKLGAGTKVKNNRGDTAAMLAAEAGYDTIVSLIMEWDARIRNTALLHATFRCQEKRVKLLLNRGADTEAVNKDGNTALLLAASGGFLSITRILLKRGAHIGAKNRYGNTALQLAAVNSKLEMVALLLEQGTDIEGKSAGGETTLHIAARLGQEKVVRLLLDRGVDLEATDNTGNTALLLAAENGRRPIVSLLLERQANVRVENNDGNTAMHLVAMKYSLIPPPGVIIGCLPVQNFPEILRLLSKRGASKDVRNKDGVSPCELFGTKQVLLNSVLLPLDTNALELQDIETHEVSAGKSVEDLPKAQNTDYEPFALVKSKGPSMRVEGIQTPRVDIGVTAL